MITRAPFAAIATLLLAVSAAKAASVHPCAADATKRAPKLLALQAESDQRGSIDKTVTLLKPVRNPAKSTQQFDVLAITGYVYKAEYRMRFPYAQFPANARLSGRRFWSSRGCSFPASRNFVNNR